jgi:hypothetical protein
MLWSDLARLYWREIDTTKSNKYKEVLAPNCEHYMSQKSDVNWFKKILVMLIQNFAAVILVKWAKKNYNI